MSEKNETLKTGTTTVGIVCKDGVVLASESKATMGYMIAHKEVHKVFQIDDKIGVTTAGGVADVQALLRYIKAQINLYKMERGEISVKAVSTFVSNILHNSRYFPLLTVLILGGQDKTGNHLYSIFPDGSCIDDKFISTGSGSPFAYGVLENEYKENMTMEQGIKLAARSVKAATERDAASGGKKIRVATITDKGFEFVDEKKINEILK
jgi:proteasome beta subunit